MKFEEPGTHPSGPNRVRNEAWSSWQDDAPETDPERRNGNSRADHDVPPSADTSACGSNGATAPLTPERLAALRHWIAGGGHNAPDVAEAVARRILDRGDL